MKRLFVLTIACWICCACASPEEDASPDTTAPEPQVGDMSGGDMSGGSAAAVEELVAEEIEPAPEPAALTRLREAVEDNPEDPEAHRRLGLALRTTGRHDAAAEHAERAAELAPDDPGVLFSLGLVYSAGRRLLEADASYRRVLELVPDNAKAANNLGNIALRRGDESGAIKWYRQAVDAEPDYVRARHKLAGVLKYYGHLSQAYEVYETIVAMSAVSQSDKQLQIDSLYNMGAINLSWKNPELAEEQLARVVLTVPNHRYAHYARGQALLELGRHDEAQQELQSHMNILHASGEGF